MLENSGTLSLCPEWSCVVLLVYGDESMDQERICAVAGVIGTEEQWDWIEPIWKSITGGVPFHANDCEGCFGDFVQRMDEDREVTVQRNRTLYRELTTLLAESGLAGFASVNDLTAQRKAFPAPYDPPLYYQGVMDVTEAMRNAAANRSDIAKITFDNRKESKFNVSVIYAYLQESGLYWSDHLAQTVVADLFAREAMKKMDNALAEAGGTKPRRRGSWEALNATGRFQVREYDETYFNALAGKMQNFERMTGISSSAFAKWIEEKRAPHCHTSYLRFLADKRGEMTESQLREFDEVFRDR